MTTFISDLLSGMPPEMLGLRMGLVALFVVLVALIAERLGPFLGAMVASLPLYTGPVYLLLALEHDAAYIGAATVTSVAICGANPVFVLIYALLARRHGALLSLAGGLAAWTACGVYVQSREWSLVEALLFVAPIYTVALWLARSFTRGVAIRRAERRWTDLVQRAVFVALLTGVVIVASRHVPPEVTGILSVTPILTTSLVLVMHPRVGGPATAALLAHTLGGLVGMVIAFAAVSLALPQIGVWPALGLGLSITLVWNVMLIAVRSLAARLRRPAAGY
ncbi:MAG: hypothetical protein R3D44_01710 [Hyphomicrobiaceae bacterium]